MVDDQHIVHRRSVEVGESIVKSAAGEGQPAIRQTIILNGLSMSDQVIVSGLQRARDGALVTPRAK